jgi:methylthioribose-1-phosphate isomerase
LNPLSFVDGPLLLGLISIMIDQKMFDGFRDSIGNFSQAQSDASQAQKKMGEQVRGAVSAAIGLPQQIERLGEQLAHQAKIANIQNDIASAQAQIAEEIGQNTKQLAEQTERLVKETGNVTRLTRGLFWLTFALAVLALVQIGCMVIELASKK